MRLVLDTNVIVAALRSPAGASARLVAMARAGRLHVGLSLPLALEYADVCGRAEVLRGAAATEEDGRRFVTALIAASKPVILHFKWRPQLPDADDEMVFETALNARADALVTFNASDFAAAAQRFGLEIAPPGAILRRVENP